MTFPKLLIVRMNCSGVIDKEKGKHAALSPTFHRISANSIAPGNEQISVRDTIFVQISRFAAFDGSPYEQDVRLERACFQFYVA